MRVLVTGAGGQLGTDICARCRTLGDDVIALDRGALDVTDRGNVASVVGDARPDVVFHSAAWTAVDACEGDPERAELHNGAAAGWVAEAASASGAYMVHVSTDYVFDGTKAGAYEIDDEPNPMSVYGRSKLSGERAVAEAAPDAAIVRTAWVMGVNGNNMLKTVLGLRDREELAFVDDQRGSPSFTRDLAVGMRHLADRRIPGLLHLTNSGWTTWYGLVREILDAAGSDPDKVRPISTDQLDPPRPAPRPANSVLADTTWRSYRLPPMPHYRETLRSTVEVLLGDSTLEEDR